MIPRPRIERKPSLALLTQAGLHVVGAGAVLAIGVQLGFYYDEPKIVTETKVLELPPACLEIEAAMQAERARAEQLATARDEVLYASAELGDVALTADADAIVEQAEALDDAKREVQQGGLDLADTQAATDAVVGDCAPERDQ